MELAELVRRMRVIDLNGKTRSAALRVLVQAAQWENEGIAPQMVLESIEAREAAAHTVVVEGLALPHAVIDWYGDYRVILGRSRKGINYEIPGHGPVHLVILFVVGREREQTHVQLLAALAELFKSEEFRQAVLNAPDAVAVENLLRLRAGLYPEVQPAELPDRLRVNSLLVEKAIELVEVLSGQALLLAVNTLQQVPWSSLENWTGRLLVITTEGEGNEELSPNRGDTHVFDVPHATLSRVDRANLGLLLAASAGLLNDRESVVCVTGPDGKRLDSINVLKPEPFFRAMFSEKGTRVRIRPAVILRVLSLSIELAAEGREAKPVGGMFVIGDSRRVMRHSQQLVLNPFFGYSRQLRNVLDPSLAETIKEFAVIDGAFVVRGDGTVLSAGTYLLPKAFSTAVPAGLGTRHQAAAAITSHTQAMAITISQSTGTVTVFRNGSVVFTLERAGLTRW